VLLKADPLSTKLFLHKNCQLQLKHVDDKYICVGPVNRRFFTSYCPDNINIIGFNIQVKIVATFGVRIINIITSFREETKDF
jgi:coenzyme F420-reducing hydrogenase gamma subunit